MSLRLVASALMTGAFVTMVAAGPALACKGATSLLRDDFNELDPAWNTVWDTGTTFSASGGKLSLKSDPGQLGIITYEGDFYSAADACVTITSPSVRDPAGLWAGLLLSLGDGSWIMPRIHLDGTASVTRLTGPGWLNPVPPRKFAAVKTGANATNTLRVVWSGPPPQNSTTPANQDVSFFINDQSFIKFKAPPNADRKIGLVAVSEGNTFQFSNLAITQ
jgi:hypothetical protein